MYTHSLILTHMYTIIYYYAKRKGKYVDLVFFFSENLRHIIILGVQRRRRRHISHTRFCGPADS